MVRLAEHPQFEDSCNSASRNARAKGKVTKGSDEAQIARPTLDLTDPDSQHESLQSDQVSIFGNFYDPIPWDLHLTIAYAHLEGQTR